MSRPLCGACGAELGLSRDPARLFACPVCEAGGGAPIVRSWRERAEDLLGGVGCIGLALLAWVVVATLGIR